MKHCHIIPLFQQLHWLPIRLRIEFKLHLTTYKVLQGLAPKYFIDLISDDFFLPPFRYEKKGRTLTFKGCEKFDNSVYLKIIGTLRWPALKALIWYRGLGLGRATS